MSEEEVEEFDKTFPPKKKEKLPGQIFYKSDVTEPPSESGSTMIEPMSVSG